VKEFAATLRQLQAKRDSLSPAEQKEIDRATELARGIAQNTTDAIQFFSAHSKTLWLAEYRRYAFNVENQAAELTKVLDSYASMNRVRAKEDRLQKTIAGE
jgi:uroporphyrinogen-III decarboxylase